MAKKSKSKNKESSDIKDKKVLKNIKGGGTVAPPFNRGL